MGSFSSLGIGLSFVFGCFLLGLVGELYYLLWWKKKNTNREIKDEYTNHTKKIFYHFLCWKRPISSLSSSSNNTQEVLTTTSVGNPDSVNGHEPDLELGSGKDLLLKGFGEESVEAELMRLHNLCGPPRFLFTIKEETKEDLESDDVKSRGDRSRKGSRTKSLNDLVLAVDNPFLTPLSSPPISSKSPRSLDSYNHRGFNPLFESSTEAEMNKLRSSPPPKFKFLRDAEEKLMRRLMEEAEKRALKNGGSVLDSAVKTPPSSTMVTEERSDGSIIKIIVGKNKEREPHHHHHSTASQVLPLASSPSTLQH